MHTYIKKESCKFGGGNTSIFNLQKNENTPPTLHLWAPQLRNLLPSFYFLIFYLFIMYTVFCLCVCLQARKGHQISFQMVVSHHMVVGNGTQNLWTSRQCSEPLNHLSSPSSSFLNGYTNNDFPNPTTYFIQL